ncbi:hypothetical protein [Candidatus Odyssella acanthamoebae]|uniref:Uncharacterized protein n=1 Tax=Candidatus Odyssella acanthamoebae TaxID=91604 RepID=A0A077AVH8_9PROT|nr:hypothetical protein [Candidatus Paracaedibacter acanthamoebae]AIK95658.1 hypothetical protein ID47_01240 [Candidatus Paracaedibacter acanthamoebae]
MKKLFINAIGGIITFVLTRLAQEFVIYWLYGRYEEYKKSKPPKRVPIKDFLAKAKQLGWNLETINILPLLSAIRQYGLDGGLSMWGKPYKGTGQLEYDPVVSISSEDWKYLCIDAISLYNINNDATIICSADYSKIKYQDIYIESKALSWLKKGRLKTYFKK